MLTGPEVVARIIAMHPGLLNGTLTPLSSGDTFGSGASWKAIRKPNDKDALLVVGAVVGQEHRTFQLLREAQTVLPQPLFRWTDDANVVWTIQHIPEVKANDYVFDCLCLRNK